MIFVEGLRLFVVLVGSLLGYEIGENISGSHAHAVIGLVIGAAVSYVVGGIAGRLADRGLQRAVFLLRNTPAGELFAASTVATTGLLFGLVAGLSLVAVFRSPIMLIITAGISWTLATIGWRIGTIKGRQVVEAAGLARILAPKDKSLHHGGALLVDGPALMERYLLVLARADLLPGGIVVPEFVLDHLRTVAHSSDPVGSRRAQRGIEMVQSLRDLGVTVHLASEEFPGVTGEGGKLMALARHTGLRIATTSTATKELATQWELPVVDLRHLSMELTPDHVPGEHLRVELIKPGRLTRQAVGYLASGDMVVVNDALHLIGAGEVEVVVLSTRPTAQGTLLFARYDGSNADEGETHSLDAQERGDDAPLSFTSAR